MKASKRKSMIKQFKDCIKKSGIKLDGLVLNLCSGPISIAAVYKRVVCYEFATDAVNELRKKNIKAVQGNIRDNFLPFKDKSFDYLFCQGLPLKPYKIKDVYKSYPIGISNEDYIEKVVSEIIRITKKKAIIISYPVANYFPEKYKSRLNVNPNNEYLIILNCK